MTCLFILTSLFIESLNKNDAAPGKSESSDLSDLIADLLEQLEVSGVMKTLSPS